MASAFLPAIEALLGTGGVLTGDDVRMRSSDPFRQVPIEADVIVRPRTTQEVAGVLRIAAEHGATVVTHGGRTGVSGGAHSVAGEIILSLERMNQIESIDPVGQIIVAQAGVTLGALQQAAEEAGLYYPVDLGARGTATVGGTISTNAGGNRTLRWGMTRDRVLGLEAVLADGTIVSSMNRLVKNNTGYDLKHLFVGAEGTLGIVTRAIFRSVAKPTSHDVALVAVPDNDAMLALFTRLQRLPSLSAFEIMYPDLYRIVTEPEVQPRPLPLGAHVYVLVESMGYHAASDRDQFEAVLVELLESGVATDAVVAQSDAQRAALWRVRESVEVAVHAIAPLVMFDVSLGVSDIDRYVGDVRAKLDEQFPGAKLIVQGHVGDNNIHLGISVGADTAAQAHAIDAIVYRGLIPYEGSMSAEHGIGTEKNAWLHVSRNGAEIALMRVIKNALDPDNRLNPRVLF
ncbi:D-lactate dehydrogenase (Cytochrome) [Sphingobium herbicidovorans NBRC 16415]|uniref:D-lactate dehydrogenase (Cytochrome) n=1 Tax=Sphingobium herbicidovorans (strain ATCC 700291 / DSM 11019 / CCUG 56400 / KCTC 2939 / LMG 18315 / NBRC 16415 / MH) TaxID=1219045 RepID=A0A086PC01_SPHHM|nr:FAD-binding oxidoreductase [Sphingobium herbicidovorans]KFG90919.1 D-lactate dehydrogenase (Cytochrome) [Sphingobium herbicidovorans NBRC 16415]